MKLSVGNLAFSCFSTETESVCCHQRAVR